jgi:hypothetical protein
MLRVLKYPEDGCWIWTGGLYKKTYGIFAWSKHKVVYAHRASYELFLGAIKEGFNVLHSCDNPPCVRPSHLFQGTQSDNIADCIAKNRNCKGEDCHKHTLTEEDVKIIKLNPNLSYQILSEILGVSYDAVYCVAKNVNWKHVTI